MSAVMAKLEWPSRSDITFIGMPISSPAVACPCLSACSLTTGTPAAFAREASIFVSCWG